MKFEIGELVYLRGYVLKMNYPEFGIIVDVKAGRYYVAFTTGFVQVFHPRWLEKAKKYLTPATQHDSG